MDSLATLRLYTKVVELRSLSAAARTLGLTPSSVSRQLSELEESLGVRLVNRTTRRLHITEAGELYYQRATRILLDLEDANLAVTRLQAAPRGSLNVTAPSSFGRLHIAPALPEFFARYPEVSVEITMSDTIVDLLAAEVDIAIRITSLQDSGFIARKLANDQRVMCASPAYLEHRGTPTRLQEMRNHNCLVYAYKRGATTWRMRTENGVEEVEVQGNLRTNSGEALLICTLAGLGVCLQPMWRVAPFLKDGSLVQLFPGYPVSTSSLDTGIYAIYPHKHHLSPKVRVFIDFLIERCWDPQYWEGGNWTDDLQAARVEFVRPAAPQSTR